MTRETKQTLMDALSAAGVDFPPSATWTQLKRLFTEHFGTDAGAAPAEDGANLDENNEEVAFADGAFGMHVGAPPQGFAPADAVANNIVRANTLETDSTAAPTVADVTVVSDSADSVSDVTAAAANSAAVASAAAAVNSAAAVNTAAAVTHAVNGSSSSTSAAACTSAVYKATSADNEELHSLQHRLEILELRQKIRELEGAAVVCNERRLDFADVEHAISKYSGDDVGHAVRSFLCDFEEVMQSINANERLKLLSLRRSLIGTARIFLATTTALNYQELKAALINEFDVAVTRQNIYRVLSQRRWNRKDESLHCYVLTMQSIAKRSDIEETEVIDFIIDGIGDGVANISLLMGAQTVDELKRLINRFQQKYLEKKPTAFVGRNTAATSVKTAVMKQAADTNVIKCFNCSQNGHIKPNCPHPLRPVGFCFRCWQMGHEHRSCTNPKKILKPFADRQIAAVDEVSDENSVNAYNLPY